MHELPNILASLFIVLAIPYLRRAFFFRPPWNTKAKKRTRRIQFFDVLRGVAILAVVGIHATDFFRLELSTETTGLLFVNAVLRFAIPLFLIASGMLLDPHDLWNEQSRWRFYLRKVARIFVPYMLLTMLWSVYIGQDSFLSILIHAVRGDVLVPYYFVVVLFELYLLYPYIIRFAAHRWFLPVSLGISVCASMASFRYAFGVPLPFEYLFFFAYGIALRPLLVSPRNRTVSLTPWLCIAGLYALGFFVAPDYYYNGAYFWGLAVFWILYLKQYSMPEVLKTGLAYVGRFSLWIFLLHYPLLIWVGRAGASWLQSLPMSIAMVFLIISTLVLSLFLAVIIVKATRTVERALRSPSVSR